MRKLSVAILIFLLVALLVPSAQAIRASDTEQPRSHRATLDDVMRGTIQHDPAVRAARSTANIQTTSVIPGREVIGFAPYWLPGAWSNYRWSTLTRVESFKIVVDYKGDMVSGPNYTPPADLIATAHANGVAVDLVVTSVDTSSTNTLLFSPSDSAKAADNIVATVVAAGADGVNIDFEGVSNSGGFAGNRQKLTNFMQVLASKMHAANPSAKVSVDLPAIDWVEAYDEAGLAAASDFVMLMAYDYWWPGSGDAGPVAPLYDTAWRANYSVSNSLNALLGLVDRSKVILGVPWYGISWSTSGNGVPSGTTSFREHLNYDKAAAQAATYGAQWYDTSKVTYHTGNSGGTFQTWTENPESLTAKYDLANQEGLLGVGIWALGYDGGLTEVWDTLEAYGGGTDTLQRLSGSNRYQTAITISRDSFPVDDGAGGVILATGTNWPDALGGSVLAKTKNAPLLLTTPDDLLPATADEIARVLPTGGQVILLGGEAALSAEVANDLTGLGFSVARLAGNDRIETAAGVATAVDGSPKSIMLGTAQNFPDILSLASPAAFRIEPILLTDPDVLSQPVVDFLSGSFGAAVTTVYLAGGTAAVSDNVAAALEARGLSVVRLAGVDRYATSATIAAWFFGGPASIGLATGENYPDGLTGAAHAAAQSAPLLLVKQATLPQSIWDYIEDRAVPISGGHVYGGFSAVSRAVQDVVQTLIVP